MRTSTKAAGVLALTMAAGPAAAITGNQLHEMVEAGTNAGAFYIVGAMEAHDTLIEMAQAAGKQAHPLFCLPQGVTRRQAADVVIAYLRSNAKDRHHAAPVLTYLALGDAWPCR